MSKEQQLFWSSRADLCVVLDEVEEDHVLPEMLDGQVEGEGGVRLEHVV